MILVNEIYELTCLQREALATGPLNHAPSGSQRPVVHKLIERQFNASLISNWDLSN